MVSCCNRRLYKGNSYEICLPLVDSGVTLVRFYTKGDVIIEKEPEISGDSMCFSFTVEELASLEDGVLRYEIVTDQETKDTNSPYVVVTPGDYSGSTLDDLLDDAFDSGYTAGQEDCSGSSCNLQLNKTVRLSEIPLIYSEDVGYYSISGNSFHVYPKEGKDGMEKVQIFGNFRPDEAISHGFNIGFSAGTDDARSRMHSLGIGINDLTFREYEEVPGIVPYRCYLFGSFSASSGYSSVFANIEVTDLYSSAYTSGYTDGFQPGYDSGYMAGRNDQKSYIIPGNFNANGTYTNPDGWSPIHINVPQSGHTDQEMQDNWDSGYTSGKTDGYESGYTAGQEACSGGSWEGIWEDGYDSGYTDGSESVDCTPYYESGVTDGYQSGYTSGHTDGFNDGYDSGNTDGFESGYDSGYTDGQASVDCTDYYNSGVTDGFGSGYTSGYTDGLNACTGYTQEDLDAAFASGWSAGYESGLTDCSGYTPATSITLNVDSAITGTGQATVTVNPSDAGTDITYTSSDPSVATINNNGGITVHQDGTVTFCAVDNLTQLQDCKTVSVTAGSGETGNYLTLEIKSDGGVVHFSPNSTGSDGKSYDYRINQNNWVENLSESCEFSVSSGDTVQFRGNDISLGLQPASFYATTASFDVHGNIMSMYRKTNFENITTIPVGHSFNNFFKDCRGLVSAENLVLPATTLQQFCYERMFENCVSLVSAPELPATTLASYCYQYMFHNCTSLTSAPELPALTLTQYCYYTMFNNCSSLEYVKCLATDISAEHSTTGWVDHVSSSGTFVKNSSMTGWSTGYDGIPTGWTVVDAQS